MGLIDSVAIAWLTTALLLTAREVWQYFAAPEVSPEQSHREPETQPAVSVVIPARNEAGNIGATLERVLELDWPALEVLVVDDASSDATGETAREKLADHPRSRVLRLEDDDRPQGWAGKRFALSRGERAAEGEWMLLIDADVHLSSGVLKACFNYLQQLRDAELGSGSGNGGDRRRVDLLSLAPHQRTPGTLLNLLQVAVYQLLDGMISYHRNNSPEAGDPVVSGGFILVRREALEGVGGHPELDTNVLIDTELARKLHRAGYRIHFARGDRLVGVEMYRTLGEALSGWRKNFWAMLGTSRGERLMRSAAITWLWLVPSVLALLDLSPMPLGWGALSLAGQVCFDGTLRLVRGQPFLTALLSPLAGVLLLYIYLTSLSRHDRGAATADSGRPWEKFE